MTPLLSICHTPRSTKLYTLSLHDALPISPGSHIGPTQIGGGVEDSARYDVFTLADACLKGERSRASRIIHGLHGEGDRKSTRLNSSHVAISYAVFCLKKKNQTEMKTYNEE